MFNMFCVFFRVHLCWSTSTHQLGPETKPSKSRTLPAPHCLAIRAHSCHHVVLSLQRAFLHLFNLELKSLSIHLGLHIISTVPSPSDTIQRYFLVVAHRSVRCVLASLFCPQKSIFLSASAQLLHSLATPAPNSESWLQRQCRVNLTAFFVARCWPSSAPSSLHPTWLRLPAPPPSRCPP